MTEMKKLKSEREVRLPSDLILYARGFYGKPAVPIDPNILDRILKGEDRKPIDPEENFLEPSVEKARAELGPFRSDEDLLLALFFSRPTLERYNKNKKATERPVQRTPLMALIQELAKRKDIRQVSIQKGSVKLKQAF